MTHEQYQAMMAALDRIAKAIEAMAYPWQVTYTVPAPDPLSTPHVPNPYWNPAPTYQPLRFDHQTGDPLPPQRPENIC